MFYTKDLSPKKQNFRQILGNTSPKIPNENVNLGYLAGRKNYIGKVSLADKWMGE